MAWLDEAWTIHTCRPPWDTDYTRLDIGRRWQCDDCGTIWRLDEIDNEYIRGRRIRFVLDDATAVRIPDGHNAVTVGDWVYVQGDGHLEPLLSPQGRLLSPKGEQGPLPSAVLPSGEA